MGESSVDNHWNSENVRFVASSHYYDKFLSCSPHSDQTSQHTQADRHAGCMKEVPSDEKMFVQDLIGEYILTFIVFEILPLL